MAQPSLMPRVSLCPIKFCLTPNINSPIALIPTQLKYGTILSPFFSPLPDDGIVGTAGVIDLNVFKTAVESAITFRGRPGPLFGASTLRLVTRVNP